MKQLFHLYGRLKDNEKSILDAIITQDMKSAVKLNKLYRMVCERENKSNFQASSELYYEPNQSAFAHLKRKLLLLMYTVIGIDLEFCNSSPLTFAMVKKDLPTIMSFTRELYIRGEFNLAVHELHTYYVKLKESNFLTLDKLLLLDQMIRFSGNNSLDIVKKKSVNNDYVFLSELQQDISKYNYLYGEISTLRSMGSNKLFDYRLRISETLDKCSDEVEELSEDSRYKEVLFCALKVCHLCSALINDYSRAREYAKKMDELLESDKLSPQDSRGGISMTIGNLEALTFNYEGAKILYKKSLNIYFSTGNVYNIGSALIRLYRIKLLQQQFCDADKYIELIEFYNLFNYKEIYNEYKYLHAIMFFAKRDYRDYIDHVIKLESAHEFNDSFKVGLKMYEIMSLMFLEYYDIIPLKIDTLRKFSYKTTGSVKLRVTLFLKVVKAFQNSGFKKSLSSNWKQSKKIIVILNESIEYKWNPLGFEVCKFDSHLIDYWFSKGISKEHLQLYNPSNNTEESANEN